MPRINSPPVTTALQQQVYVLVRRVALLAARVAALEKNEAALASAVVGSAGTPLRLMHASEPPTPPSDDLVLVDVTKP